MAAFVINALYSTVENIDMAALAQLVEQHFCKVKVLGSNPRGGSKG